MSKKIIEQEHILYWHQGKKCSEMLQAYREQRLMCPDPFKWVLTRYDYEMTNVAEM